MRVRGQTLDVEKSRLTSTRRHLDEAPEGEDEPRAGADRQMPQGPHAEKAHQARSVGAGARFPLHAYTTTRF